MCGVELLIYIHYNVWVELRIHSQTSTVQPLSLGMDK